MFVFRKSAQPSLPLFYTILLQERDNTTSGSEQEKLALNVLRDEQLTLRYEQQYLEPIFMGSGPILFGEILVVIGLVLAWNSFYLVKAATLLYLGSFSNADTFRTENWSILCATSFIAFLSAYLMKLELLKFPIQYLRLVEIVHLSNTLLRTSSVFVKKFENIM